MAISQIPSTSGGSLSRRVDLFTSSGTWTAPAGVTYAIAHIRAGGGGGGGRDGTTGSTGGSSSAFSTTAVGGRGGASDRNSTSLPVLGGDAPANSGLGGGPAGHAGSTISNSSVAAPGGDGTLLVVGSAVTPGTGYTITIGSGGAGAASGGAGGSGVVWIEYEVAA